MADSLLWQTLFIHNTRKKDRFRGGKGFHVDTEEGFKEAFKQALQEKGPVWICCDIDREIKVLPMIPNGGTVDDMILE